MKYKLFVLLVFSLIEIGNCMDEHNSKGGLRHRRPKKYDDLPVLPPQGGTSSKPHVGTVKHVPKPKPASPKPPNPQMPSAPLPKPEETPVSLNEICDAFGVPFESENALRQQNFNALEGPSQAKFLLLMNY